MIVLLTGYQILHYWRHGAFRRLVANPDDDDQAALENDDRGELPLDDMELNPANCSILIIINIFRHSHFVL